jgi:hypothetical protein
MKRLLVTIGFTALALLPSAASAQPKSVPQMAKVAKGYDETFGTLKNYFAPGYMNLFEIVSADQASGAIVVKRSNIDQNTWSKWAYCKLSPMHMLDTLRDGSVTVHIKLQRAGSDSTYVTVATDFQATYGLGSALNTAQCISTGLLEKDIMAAAGAAPAPQTK